MKKNYFKKIASVAAASAVLTAAMANLTSVSAAGEYQLNIAKVTLEEPTKDLVDVKIAVGADTEYRPNSIGLAIYFDSRLKYDGDNDSKYFNDSGLLYKETSDKEGMSVIYFAAGGLVSKADKKAGIGANTDLITFSFYLPDDAKAGDVYPITWLEDADTNLFDTNSTDYKTTLIPHVNNDGYIAITPPPTTPVTTTEAPVVTTEAPVVTTEAPATTTTVTTTTTAITTTTTAPGTTVTTTTTTPGTTVTTTKATTKSTKDTQKNSPNTGNSANGVAGLVATMVVAAGAAVALKKKKD